ncbi:MAG: Ig-like domain-containing protein [Bacteroidales bacterium]|jgi:hypothetical protein
MEEILFLHHSTFLFKRILIVTYLTINSFLLSAQVTLTVEGNDVNDTETGEWSGFNVPRDVPTAFTFRNNSISSINYSGYMLQAGDEDISSSNNNLDGEIITGNRFIWNGTDMTSITHGVFTGYNINAVIEYNYLDKVPMGIIRKSNGMTNVSGGVAYNIVKTPVATGLVVKGMNNVNIYNNTFYSDQMIYQGPGTGTWRGLVDIYANDSFSPPVPSTGTKIINNIFYTKYQIANIYIYENEDLTDFESDYNVFYCEAGTPMFNYLGVAKTFAEWQALGYDTHSVIVNPKFKDLIDFVPATRLDYGKDLDTEWQTGLSTNATWNLGVSPATANQNGTWQVGARIYNASATNPYYVSSVVEDSTPAMLEMTYNLSLTNIVPANSAFNVQVNHVNRIINSIAIVGSKVRLTLASPVGYGDIITVAYTKPANNPLQTASGYQAASFTAQPVINNCINNGLSVVITSPGSGSSFTAPANITITVNASDSDGTISKVEFFNGPLKLAEITTPPYLYNWNNVNSGTYFLTVIATDNSNATSSASLTIHVNPYIEDSTELIKLFPNPNAGLFTIEIIKPSQDESYKISIVSLAGEKVYDGILLNNESTKQFDLSFIDPGIYILMIIGKEILITGKFIKN